MTQTCLFTLLEIWDSNFSRTQVHKDFNRFIAIAAGSAAELRTQLEILKRVEGSLNEVAEQLQEYCSEVSAMLWSLRKSLD
jgi:four helix bundle protein